GGGAVGDDAGHGVAAAVVVTEDLAEEAPDGGGGAEQAVAGPDAVVVEGLEDAGLGQGGGEGAGLVAREAGADLIQGGHEGSRMSAVRGRAQEARWARSGQRKHARESPPGFIVRGVIRPRAACATSLQKRSYANACNIRVIDRKARACSLRRVR